MVSYSLKGFAQFPQDPKIHFTQPLYEKLLCSGCFILSCSLARDSDLNGFCQACRRGKTTMYDDDSIWESVKEIAVCCPNRKNGCTYVDTLELTSSHAVNCPKKGVLCPLGCGTEIVSSQLVTHLRDVCSERYLSCKFCKKEQKACQLSAHEDDCPDKPATCRFCHLDVGQQRNLEGHYNACELIPLKCPFETFGCKFQGTRKQLKEHEDTNSHLTVLVEQVKGLQKTCTALEQQRKAEEERRKTLEGKVDELKQQKEDLERRFDDICARFGNLQDDLRVITGPLQNFLNELK